MSGISPGSASPLVEQLALPATFAEHVRSLLEDQIIDGRLAGGQRVREVELSELLGVSRTPVREALRALERDGLVLRARGRGTVIAPFLEPAEILTLYAVRQAIEPFLAGRAATRLDPVAVSYIESAQADFDELARTSELSHSDVRKLVATDSKIHSTMYVNAGSALMTVVDSYWARLLRERHFLYAKSGREQMLTYSEHHERIVDALRRRNAEDASRFVQEHLDIGGVVLRRLLIDGDGAGPKL